MWVFNWLEICNELIWFVAKEEPYSKDDFTSPYFAFQADS